MVRENVQNAMARINAVDAMGKAICSRNIAMRFIQNALIVMAQEFARHAMSHAVNHDMEDNLQDYTPLRIDNYEYGFGIHVATIQL